MPKLMVSPRNNTKSLEWHNWNKDVPVENSILFGFGPPDFHKYEYPPLYFSSIFSIKSANLSELSDSATLYVPVSSLSITFRSQAVNLLNGQIYYTIFSLELPWTILFNSCVFFHYFNMESQNSCGKELPHSVWTRMFQRPYRASFWETKNYILPIRSCLHRMIFIQIMVVSEKSTPVKE